LDAARHVAEYFDHGKSSSRLVTKFLHNIINVGPCCSDNKLTELKNIELKTIGDWVVAHTRLGTSSAAASPANSLKTSRASGLRTSC